MLTWHIGAAEQSLHVLMRRARSPPNNPYCHCTAPMGCAKYWARSMQFSATEVVRPRCAERATGDSIQPSNYDCRRRFASTRGSRRLAALLPRAAVLGYSHPVHLRPHTRPHLITPPLAKPSIPPSPKRTAQHHGLLLPFPLHPPKMTRH